MLNNVVVIAVLLSLRGGRHATPRSTRSADDTGCSGSSASGTTAGIVAMTVVLWPAIRRAGIRLRWTRLSHPAVRKVARLSGWTVGYVVANQVALLVVLALANGERVGGVSLHRRLHVLPAPPRAVRGVAHDDVRPRAGRAAPPPATDAGYKRQFSLGIRLISLVVLPAAVGYVVLAGPIVGALVEWGAFERRGERDRRLLAEFAIGLLGLLALPFTLRGFYVLQDTRMPFFLNVVENAINIVAGVRPRRASG